MESFDVVIVGGGLAGLSAAYTLARDGIGALVVEKGDYSGAKNVTGGRIYLNPVRQLLPDIWDEAPLERFIAKEKIVLMGDESSTAIELSSNRFRQKPYHSYSILRAKFDQWFCDKATAAGAMVITKNRVDDVVIDNGRVAGIVAGEDKIAANCVILADGVMSLMAGKAGLRRGQPPGEYALGIKEVVELPAKTIEERFGLAEGEGEAQALVGSLTQGMFGGGFLYTNKESISLGLVVGIKDLSERQPPIEAPELIEDFKRRPEIARLIAGGETVEYSAHVIAEAGLAGLSRLYGDGVLVTGDAAGFTLNAGLLVRGMEFAIASGVMAARAVKMAKEKNDFSAPSLSVYQRLLEDSFVLKDLRTFRHAPHILENPRLFKLYPQLASEILEKIMYVGDQPKAGLVATAMDATRGKRWTLLRDLNEFRKL